MELEKNCVDVNDFVYHKNRNHKTTNTQSSTNMKQITFNSLQDYELKTGIGHLST